MKQKISILFLFITIIILGQTAPAYYNGINFQLSGNAMKDQLATLISKQTKTSSYSDLLKILPKSDEDPAKPGNMLLIYGSSSTGGKDERSRIASGSWNREHTFAKSLGTPNLGTSGPGADPHHIRPSDIQKNSDRGSLLFADGAGTVAGSRNGGWFPGDEWKGDVARMMMFMYVRYKSQAQAINVGLGPRTYTSDMPDIFLKWNVEDPVSYFERQRNNVVYTEQGNRNPFIDNPYLATVIWKGPAAQNTWPGNFSTDTQAPTAPTSLTFAGVTESSVSLSWDASTDNVAVTGYEIYIDGVLQTTVSGSDHSYTVTGLTASTTYNFYVKAIDAAYNMSEASNTISATTSISTDTEAPSTPLGLTVGNATPSSIVLSWSASTDNVGVIGYNVYVDGSLYNTVSGTTATVSGLTPKTTYSFYVLAKDAAKNISGNSAAVQGTTSEATSVCGMEDFESMPSNSSSYSPRTWSSNGITWDATLARTDETINNRAITINTGGRLNSSTKANGIGSLTITTQLKYSGSEGLLDVLINGTKVGTVPYSDEIETTTIADINISGNVVISIQNNSTISKTRVAIDDLSWSCYTAPLGTNETNAQNRKLSVTPNPVKHSFLEIQGLSNEYVRVEIYNMAGQIIQTVDKVSKTANKIQLKNTNKGIYILKAGSQSVKFLID